MTSTTQLGLTTHLVIGLSVLLLTASCDRPSETTVQRDPTSTDRKEQDDSYALLRRQMVDRQLAARGIKNERVLDAIRRVPRHQFVPGRLRDRAYDDSPLPIGNGQTISQPYIVGLMTELVDLQADDRVLDVGTGSGYQAAVLAELVQHVDSIEIVESLAKDATERLKSLGYNNIRVRHGDGYAGLQSEAPFDAIVVAAAPDHVPPALIDQLAAGGKMVIPVGDRLQSLMLIEKHSDGEVVRRNVAPVMFVPMTGEAEK